MHLLLTPSRTALTSSGRALDMDIKGSPTEVHNYTSTSKYKYDYTMIRFVSNSNQSCRFDSWFEQKFPIRMHSTGTKAGYLSPFLMPLSPWLCMVSATKKTSLIFAFRMSQNTCVHRLTLYNKISLPAFLQLYFLSMSICRSNKLQIRGKMAWKYEYTYSLIISQSHQQLNQGNITVNTTVT